MYYLFFDTETNGLPTNYSAPVTDTSAWPRVTQLAWALYNEDGKKFKSFSGMIKPDGWEVPKTEFFITNNITTERCEQEGWPLKDVMKHFIYALEDCSYLIAHNMNFDLPIMACEMTRLDVKSNNKPQKFCTMLKTTDVCKIPNAKGTAFKWPKLEELHRFLFGCDFEGAHDAGFDVEATAKCFFELKKRNLIQLPEIPK